MPYRSLHPNTSLNFQLNRWLAGMTPEALTDVAAVAERVRDYPQWTEEFLALGDRLLAGGRERDAALSYRAGEFFLTPDDPRRSATRARFIELSRAVHGVEPDQMLRIPYPPGVLPGYRFGEPRRGTVLMFGGFDSYLEEFLPIMRAIADAGFEIVGFEGPGQGGALEDSGIPMTRDWHLPVAAVLDHLNIAEATLVGISLGGCLAIRAAAREPRITRVVADDVLTDFLACNLRRLPATRRIGARVLLALRARRIINAVATATARRDLLTRWGIRQGQHVFGVPTPYDYLTATARMITADVSPLVRADVLLLAGAEDHYVPLTQLTEQVHTLRNARSVTARVFTAEEDAANHCHVGNIALSVRVMLDWLNTTNRTRVGVQ